MRNPCELMIVKKTAEALINKGYSVSVNDGEETVLKKSTDVEAIMRHVDSTEEDYFRAFDFEGKRIGTVWFIYGNGPDVITDYTTTLDDAMQPVLDYAETFNYPGIAESAPALYLSCKKLLETLKAEYPKSEWEHYPAIKEAQELIEQVEKIS